MATFAATPDGQSVTGTAWPNVKSERITAPRSSDLIQTEAQLNAFLGRLSAYLAVVAGDGPITTATPTIGTTVTMATPAQVINITGTPITVTAETAKAFGSLGTIPTTKWGLIAIDRVANATTSFVSAAANYTTGYATEALAIAAMPAVTAVKARTGYITIYASHANGWVAGTDALAGGTGGNPAGETNYYGIYGTCDTAFWSNFAIGNLRGTIVTTANSY
jgi:hypothetical protein